ncbi:MAG: PDZ domain-containing protein, partial [Bacteroidales bacterium]|nr:PDZ domain-containing protein [Bacteroidales bacterium]
MGDAKKTLRIVILCVVMLVLGSLITRVSDMMRTPEVQIPQGGWTKLQLVLSQIDQNYVDEVDRKGITEDILPKLLEKLDPHSVYLPPKNLEEATEELQGNFDGIGITFNIPQDTAIVISVISGGPSERAGLIPGDRILSVDGKAVAGVKINQDSLVSKMRGVSGTKVKLEILREKEVVDFEITRAKIPVNSIDVAYMINDTTGYMKLT